MFSQMFVRLDELCHGPTGDVRWQEKARWIKFEEDVEEEAHRWGKPHLASISFRSMVDLRKCLKKGAVLLDIEEEDLNSIAQRIAEQLVYIDQLEPECKKPLLKVLLKKHRHTDDKKNFIRRRSFSVSKSARYTAPFPPTTNLTMSFFKQANVNRIREIFKNQRESCSTRQTDIHSEHAGVHFNAMLARILKGAEATSVMVGTLGIINNPVCAFVRLSEARPLKGLTEVALPIRFLFLLLVPPGDNVDHYEVGRAISALMANPMFRDAMYDAENRADILDAILDYLDDSIVLPPGEWDKKTLLPIINMAKKKKSGKTEKSEDDKGSTDRTFPQVILLQSSYFPSLAVAPPPEDTLDDPLRRTKRPFGGLVNDIKRRYPKYLSDIKDGLNLQCFATILFIYFACLSPAITFGGLLTEKTERWLGVTEMLVGVSLCGLTFSLVSGQPMLIVGATGPLLVFEEALFQICGLMGVDFISLRVWVGIWVTIITLLVVALEGSFLIHYFTRFIHEIFAALISLILILETLKKLFLIFVYHPLSQFYPDPNPNLTMCLEMADNATLREVVNQPNTALLSMILCFGTFFIAYSLRSFKTSKFLGKHARHVIGDFAIPIAILIMVTLDYFINDTYTEKLDVPDGLKPTDSNKRGWFINPLGSSEASLPVWGMFFAIIPALLMFILVFMETEVTTMILDQKDRQLRKGSGYHLDLLLVGSFATISGLVGFPFVCPATLRSISHISALSVFSATQAPGEKPQLLEVKEQRITAFGVHILLGVSVLMGPLLRLVPIAVLFGVFFYMGVVAMHGLQMVDRVKYMFMPVKHHPDIGYVTRVRTFKMNLFTVIQLSCLALLGVIKFTKAALAFPFVLLMLVPLRLFVLKLFFTDTELREVRSVGIVGVDFHGFVFQLDNEESGSSEEVARQAGEISEDDEEEDNEGGTGGGGGDDDIYRPISTPVN
ncbi:hypothetical protein CAPTEDRAFT_129057 [Capitella teleta]|uniref:Anion exchange protein n=1 Tax=Capitella teleta TaxID=283909 RepID=R7U0M0_CAPTE|nr:hypothetical protein CAPTEDRAFT_129057 [Capitella teleta]|eukprot:ELT99392.1 hypothetical protein CAPTEDRAFT_129057 [Capitella teleta]